MQGLGSNFQGLGFKVLRLVSEFRGCDFAIASLIFSTTHESLSTISTYSQALELGNVSIKNLPVTCLYPVVNTTPRRSLPMQVYLLPRAPSFQGTVGMPDKTLSI